MLKRDIKLEDITYCMLVKMKNEDTTSNQFALEDITKKDSNISAAYLDVLSTHRHQQILLNVANHPNTTKETLLSMYGPAQYNWVNNVVVKRVGSKKLKSYENNKTFHNQELIYKGNAFKGKHKICKVVRIFEDNDFVDVSFGDSTRATVAIELLEKEYFNVCDGNKKILSVCDDINNAQDTADSLGASIKRIKKIIKPFKECLK